MLIDIQLGIGIRILLGSALGRGTIQYFAYYASAMIIGVTEKS